MVALRQVEIPYYRAVGRQRGRKFGALAQVIDITAIPFLRKYVVPEAKRIVADMLEFAAPEIGQGGGFSGRKIFKTAAKSVRKQTLKKQYGTSSKQKRIIPTNCTKQSSRSQRFLQTFLVHHVKQLLVPTFCDSVWKSWR